MLLFLEKILKTLVLDKSREEKERPYFIGPDLVLVLAVQYVLSK